jgi:hypothetical protein
MTDEAALRPLDRLAGRWVTEVTHPALPGIVVHGTVMIEWLEGRQFLILRSRNDHPDFPDAVSIIGFTGADRVGAHDDESAPKASRLCMHYFDSRGVFRVYEANIDADTWRLWRDAPGFSQRFEGRFADGGDTVVGLWRLCEDDANWKDDLRITYRRQ